MASRYFLVQIEIPELTYGRAAGRPPPRPSQRRAEAFRVERWSRSEGLIHKSGGIFTILHKNSNRFEFMLRFLQEQRNYSGILVSQKGN